MYILHFMQFLVYTAFNQIFGKAAEEEKGKKGNITKVNNYNYYFFFIYLIMWILYLILFYPHK